MDSFNVLFHTSTFLYLHDAAKPNIYPNEMTVKHVFKQSVTMLGLLVKVEVMFRKN